MYVFENHIYPTIEISKLNDKCLKIILKMYTEQLLSLPILIVNLLCIVTVKNLHNLATIVD